MTQQQMDKKFNVENPERITSKGNYTLSVQDVRQDEINCRVLDGPLSDSSTIGTSGRSSHFDPDVDNKR